MNSVLQIAKGRNNCYVFNLLIFVMLFVIVMFFMLLINKFSCCNIMLFINLSHQNKNTSLCFEVLMKHILFMIVKSETFSQHTYGGTGGRGGIAPYSPPRY
jgi:hypothetical protein